MREEQRLRVFENGVPRKTCRPKRDEVTEEWRKLHNEEFNDQYPTQNIICMIKQRRMKWAGHVAHMRERRGAYRVLVGKPDGKSPLERPRHRREGNSKMYHKAVGGGHGLD
jgi:hypothetical protein